MAEGRPQGSSDDDLDQEIEALEAKLGYGKDAGKAQRKMSKWLDSVGLGTDFFDLLDGKLDQEAAEDEAPQSESIDQVDSEGFEEPAPVKKRKIRFADEIQVPAESQSEDDPQPTEEQTEPPTKPTAPNAADPELAKTVKGIFNRLSDSNIDTITSQIVALYQQHPGGAVTEVLAETLLASVVESTFVPQYLIAVYCCFLAGISRYIGKQVAAYVVEQLFHRWLKDLAGSEATTLKNAAHVMGYFYLFEIFQPAMILGLANHIIASGLNEGLVDLLSTLFTVTGFKLRKDDPAGLKTVILDVQEKCVPLGDNTRVQFMLQTLTEIRCNRRKEDPMAERLKFLRTWLKKTLGSKLGARSTKLEVSWDDLAASTAG